MSNTPAFRTCLILGGARSGKTRRALDLAEAAHQASGAAPVYVATAEALDGEMSERIRNHQAERGGHWRTLETPLDLPGAISDAAAPDAILLVDCLTLWLNNLMFAERDPVLAAQELVAALRDAAGPILVVSNEVGLGIVPENALARRFRDEAGRLNQTVAAAADRVEFVAAGLPLALKS